MIERFIIFIICETKFLLIHVKEEPLSGESQIEEFVAETTGHRLVTDLIISDVQTEKRRSSFGETGAATQPLPVTAKLASFHYHH